MISLLEGCQSPSMRSDLNFKAEISPATAPWSSPAMPMSCLRSQTPEPLGGWDVKQPVRGSRPLSTRHAELPKSDQPFEVVVAGPHPEPAISLRTEPAPRVSRLLTAVRGLQLVGVHHAPTPIRFGHEAGAWVPWLGGAVHDGKIALVEARCDPCP